MDQRRPNRKRICHLLYDQTSLTKHERMDFIRQPSVIPDHPYDCDLTEITIKQCMMNQPSMSNGEYREKVVECMHRHRIHVHTEQEYNLFCAKHAICSMDLSNWKYEQRKWIDALNFLLVNAPTLQQRFYAYLALKKVDGKIKSKKEGSILKKFMKTRTNQNPDYHWSEKALTKKKIANDQVLIMLMCFNHQSMQCYVPDGVRERIASYLQ